MFSHIMVGANNIEESKVFYDNLLGVLGAQPGILMPNPVTGQKRYFYFHDNNIFAINEPIDGNQATSANGSTIGFNVKDVDQGNAWHQAGVDNGGTSIEDPPGIREYDGNKMFLAYLRDPSGNKLCGLLRIE
ncbi:uncharacterized protein METZ01_LOCUS108846 [marine metagenome]|uniref:VOC domain-containing protein n=1 Tax=marine metagenome TaxID=408172 RepID=A0A381WUF7_9ZZZZ